MKSDPTLDRLARKYLGKTSDPKKTIPLHDRPLAAHGLASYRYKGRYGWIMIGATNTNDALREASRSTGGECFVENLQLWNGTKYENVR